MHFFNQKSFIEGFTYLPKLVARNDLPVYDTAREGLKLDWHIRAKVVVEEEEAGSHLDKVAELGWYGRGEQVRI